MSGNAGIRIAVRSSLIGVACGLAYELAGLILQFAWDGIGIHNGPVIQIRFLQAFILGLLTVALAGFLPAVSLRLSGRKLSIGLVAGAVSGAWAGAIIVLFDYLQHFHYFTDRGFTPSWAGYVLNAFAVSPALFLLITAACALIAAVSALLYLVIDLEVG